MFPQQLVDHGDVMMSSRRTVMPHNNDVLLGRGGNNNKHIGNAQLRSLARAHVATYSRASKKDKSKISREIVNHVRSMNPPGRFLKRHQFSEEWEDVGDDIAREKASQALRDAVSSKDTVDELDQELLASAGNSAAASLPARESAMAPSSNDFSQQLRSQISQQRFNDAMQPGMQNGMHNMMNPPASSAALSLMSGLANSRLQQLQMQHMQQIERNSISNSMFQGMAAMNQQHSAMNQQHSAMNLRFPSTTLNENSTALPPAPPTSNMHSMMESSAASSVDSSTSSTASRYKYYGNFRPKVPQLKKPNTMGSNSDSQRHHTGGMTGHSNGQMSQQRTNAELSDRRSSLPTTMSNFAVNSNPNVLPAVISNDPTSANLTERYGATTTERSSLPSLYQHIEDRIRYRNVNGSRSRNRQHVHFNDRSSLGRSSIGRSSMGKSSMGVETISNYSSRMASEADLDLSNFDWVRNPEVTSVRTDMSWNSCDS